LLASINDEPTEWQTFGMQDFRNGGPESSQGILSSSMTCGISGCSEGSPACYCPLVVIFNCA